MIEVQNLGKKYGNFEALHKVTFSVGRGEVLGLLGPNGAGKTSIMKMISGCSFPSSGCITIDGISVAENSVAIKNRIGYLPEIIPLYPDMTAEEYLYFTASARLLAKETRRSLVDKALSACGVEASARRQRIETLSKGYKQRLGLAQAILHDPDILILDEPTSGLDPNQLIEMRALITELGKSKTVILSTHILQEVEAVCSRVLILNKGSIAAQGTPAEISRVRKSLNNNNGNNDDDTWELQVKGGLPCDMVKSFRDAAAATGNTIKTITAENENSGVINNNAANVVKLTVTISGQSTKSANGEIIFDWAVKHGYKIISMNLKQESIEDMFVSLTKDIE